MSTLDEPKLMTVEEFLALPDDGVERWLINGELRGGDGMTVRNFRHAELTMKLGYELLAWLKTQPEPRGHVVGGEAGFRLPNAEKTFVGSDVAYVSAEAAKSCTRGGFIQGAPVVAIEILSPSDRVEDIDEKIDAYLAAGTPAVWIVHCHRKTITVYAANQPPEGFNVAQALQSNLLPGFLLRLSDLYNE